MKKRLIKALVYISERLLVKALQMAEKELAKKRARQ